MLLQVPTSNQTLKYLKRMTNTLKSTKEPAGFASRILHRLVRMVPRHMKRAILWASIICAYRRNDAVDQQCINALNEVLSLCKKQGAVNMSAALSRVIWKDVNGAVEVLKVHPSTPEQIASARGSFIAAIPKWLRYSSNKRMGADFDAVMRNRTLVGI